MGRGRQTRQRDRPSKHQQEQEYQEPSRFEDLTPLYQEVGDHSYQSPSKNTWKGMARVLFVLLGVFTFAVALGLGAGMAVSIQFYEGAGRSEVSPPTERMTGWDSDILSGNTIPQHGSNSRRVVKQTVLGGKTELPLVQETSMNEESARPGVRQTPDMFLSEATVLPTVCSDGSTIGFNDWSTLKAAIHEANALSAERFLRWNEYFAQLEEDEFPITFDDDMLYYETDSVFTMCPGAILKGRKGPIFVNAENVVIRCEGCVVHVGGSHLAFGPHAKHVLVRGVTFTGADLASVTFYHDGSDVSFEECTWHGNRGDRRGYRGEIADFNSTSTATFTRCDIRSGSSTAMKVHGKQ